ncbi:MAG: hypothetical protein ACM3ME_00955, partial [Chloroflexota bacterium]
MGKIYLAVLGFIWCISAFGQPFTAVNNPFPGMARGAQAFVDLDNDNDLDLIMCGQDNTFSPMAKVYVNDAGTF